MNRKLRAAIWIVAVVSIAIALYYPVTQYLEGRAIDDEMLKLRRMKAEAVSGAPDAEVFPVQTDRSAAPGGTPGDLSDPGLETPGSSTGETGRNAELEGPRGGLTGLPEKPNADSTDQTLETDGTAGGTTDRTPVPDETASGPTDRTPVPNKTANDPTGRMAESDETVTDRKTALNEAALNTPGETVMKDENTENAIGRDAEAGKATEATTGSVSASEDETTSNTDWSTNALRDMSGGMPEHSEAAGTERSSGGTDGSGNGETGGNAGSGTVDSAQTRQQSSEGGTIETQGIGARAPDGTAGTVINEEGEPDKPFNFGTARDVGGTGERQTGVGEAISPEPGSPDNPIQSEKSAVGGTPSPVVKPAPSPVPETEPVPFVFDESRILPEYKALYEENRDLVGWLKIDGTMVDYPVLQRADEEYYLTRDFYGNANANGQLILDAQCDPFTPDVNLVISGHDMKSGKMFGTLQRYASERFGEQHPIIEFDTLFWRGRYRLIAAFQTWDYLKREDGFRYNVDISYRLELINYLEALDQIKLYDTGVAVEFGDQLITLSTCSTQTDDGRFVVVARRLREGEQP